MQQLQRIQQDIFQCPESGCLAVGVVRIVKPGLYHFNIPVTEFIPDEIIYLLYGNTQFEVLHVVGHFFYHMVQLGKDPFIHRLKVFIRIGRNGLSVHIHHDKTGGVPYLIGKITACFHSFKIEPHVVSGCISGNQRETQRVGAVLVNDFQRINAVAQGFGHFSSLGIPYQAMEKHCGKGLLSHLLIPGENHADNPEENDIISGNKHIRGIKIIQILGFIRPAQRGKRPECGGKPGIKRIGILGQMRTSTLRADIGHFLCHHDFPAFVTVIGGYPVSPPQLPGNTPVADVVCPVKVSLVHTFGYQADISIFHTFHSRFYQLVHFHEPLFLD